MVEGVRGSDLVEEIFKRVGEGKEVEGTLKLHERV